MRSCATLICTIAAAVLAGAVGPAFAAGSWSAPQQLDHSSTAIPNSFLVACASDSLCVGVGGSSAAQVLYHLQTGMTPASTVEFGPLSPFGEKTGTELASLQCPGVSECLGVTDTSDGEDPDELDVIASIDPADPSSWASQDLSDTDVPTQLSCPTTSFCAGPGAESALVTSDHPFGGSWKVTNLPGDDIDEVTCSSGAFCAAFDAFGNVWTSTDPDGGSAAWVKSGARAPLIGDANADANGDLGGGDTDYNLPEFLGCTGPNLCVAAGPSGTILVSTDPAGSAPWTPVRATPGAITAVACEPGTALCLAGDSDGDIATSNDGAGATWTSVLTSAGRNAILDLSCTGHTCIAAPGTPGSEGGTPLLATVPAGAAAWQWNAFEVPTFDAVSSVACPSAIECIGVDQFQRGRHSHYFTSVDPAQGVGSWHTETKVATLGISCYSSTGCLAVTNDGGFKGDRELEAFAPVGGAHGFHGNILRDRDGDQETVDFVTCAQGTCVAGYPHHWYQSAHPPRSKSWHQIAHPRFDVTCLTGNHSCVALLDAPFSKSAGPDLLVAATRSGPWKREAIDPRGKITGLACTRAHACVVVDQAGNMLVSRTPAAGPGAWHFADTDQNGFDDIACQTARTCIAVDNNGGVVVGRP